MLATSTFSKSKYRSAALAALLGMGLVACDQTTESTEMGRQNTESTEMSLETQDQRVSYGIALNMGRRMKAEGVPLDAEAFAAGIRDAVSGGEAQMTDEEINAEMMAMQEQMQSQQEAEMQVAATANLEVGQAYLDENATAEGVQITESGLQYKVVKAGTGAKPTSADSVEVHYEGRLINGTVFDSSYSRGEPVTFGVTQVIPGWTEALQLMSEGAEYELTIPSELAYGAGGAGGAIGPNEVLVFKVELLSVVTAGS